MPTENCIYRSITLAANEEFTLPPGAEIIGSSNINSITSTCPLPTNLEQLGCYGFVVVAATGVNGGETEVWEDTQITFLGLNYDGIDYPFVSAVGYDGASIITQISLLPFGAAFSNFCISSCDETGNQSLKFYVIFNTFPSIAQNLKLYGTTSSPNSGSGIPQVPFEFPCLTRDEIVAAGNCNVCSNCISES